MCKTAEFAAKRNVVTPREHKDMRYIIIVAVLAVVAILIYIGVTGG